MSHRVETFDVDVVVLGQGSSRFASLRREPVIQDGHTDSTNDTGRTIDFIREATTAARAIQFTPPEEHVFTVLPSLDTPDDEVEVSEPEPSEVNAAADAFKASLKKDGTVKECPYAPKFINRDPTPAEVAAAVKAFEARVLAEAEGFYGTHQSVLQAIPEAAIQARGNKRFVKETAGRPPSEQTLAKRALAAANQLFVDLHGEY